MISIVIPTYNRAHLIARTIESVIAQTFTDWELIIVDDGSSDNTENIISRYLLNERIKYQKKDNTGAAHTRNVGASLASGTWLTFLDSDDEAEPEWLQEIANFFNDPDVAIVCCGLSRIDSKGNVIDYKYPKQMSPVFNGVTGRFTNGGIFALVKKHFDAIGGYDNELKSGQHTELAIRLIPYLEKKKLKIQCAYKALIKIHIHDGERIRFNQKALYEGTNRFLLKHHELLRKDKHMMVDYLNLLMVSSAKLGFADEAKKTSRKALTLKPFSWKQWFRFIALHVNSLRKKYYGS
jgi:glycosyltransferase involved in cell wall biosynthesis